MTAPPAVGTGKQLHAGGTIWRLRSLIAMGHDSSRIARAMNVRPETIRKLVRGDAATVSPEFRELARDVWNVWWDKRPPERTRSERRAASAARRRAERHGWPAAAALDEDELDEPGYKPFSRYRPAMGIGIAPDFPSLPGRTRQGSRMSTAASAAHVRSARSPARTTHPAGSADRVPAQGWMSA